jgi:hypothetical protein
LTSIGDICDNFLAVLLRVFRRFGFVFLLAAVGLMLAQGGVWAAHDCCGHPSDTAQAADSGTETPSSGDDCVCPSCQADIGISLLTGLSIHFASWWSVESSTGFVVSRFETDIFRPPLA